MTYVPRDYLYVVLGGLIGFVAVLWLSPLDLDSDTMLALVGVFFGIAVAQWLFGRKW